MSVGPNLRGAFQAPPSPAIAEPRPSPSATATLVMSQAGGEELRVICPQVLLRLGCGSPCLLPTYANPFAI